MGIHGVGPVQAGKLVKLGFTSIQGLREYETIQHQCAARCAHPQTQTPAPWQSRDSERARSASTKAPLP